MSNNPKRGVVAITCGLSLLLASPVLGVPGANPLADPFGATLQEPPPAPPPPVQEEPLPPPVIEDTVLPPGLRVILIRHDGQGLLAVRTAGAPLIPVRNGKSVEIAGESYQAKVSVSGVRLFRPQDGKLVWEGSLVGDVPPTLPPDVSELKFVPPLSAGVSPGLRGGGSSSSPNSSTSNSSPFTSRETRP